MSEPRPSEGEERAADEGSNGGELVPDPVESSAPAIPAAKSVHRCTPQPVLDLVYEVLGCPVGIDPCSNPRSIVKAHRTVMPPENGIDVAWHKYKTGFVNPPFGKVEEPRWIRKAIQEARMGWEGILLLPSKTGAPWFEPIYQHSPCVCFYGSPELDVEGRIWFHEEDGGATFNTEFVYLGPRYESFARAFARAGHLVYPRHDQALTVRITGRTMPGVEFGVTDQDELFQHSIRRLRAARHDAWAQATDGIPPDTPVRDLPPELRAPIEELTIHEARHAMLLLARDEPIEPPATTRKKKKRATHAAPQVDRRQVGLPMHTDGRAYHNEAERERFDARVLDTIQRAGHPLSRAEIMAANPCTEHEYRGCMKRLKKAGRVEQVDEGRHARYSASPRTEQDEPATTTPDEDPAGPQT